MIILNIIIFLLLNTVILHLIILWRGDKWGGFWLG